MTPEEIDAVVREYADAQAHANDDRDRPCPTVYARDGIFGVRSMARLADAEADVLALRGEESLPAPVTDFIRAEADKGCRGCWVSSRRGKNHPECNEKIDRWFAARDALTAYGRSRA